MNNLTCYDLAHKRDSFSLEEPIAEMLATLFAGYGLPTVWREHRIR